MANHCKTGNHASGRCDGTKSSGSTERFSFISLVCVLQVVSSSRPSVGVMNVEGSRRVTQSGVWIVFCSRCFFSASIYRPDRSRSMEVVSYVQKAQYHTCEENLSFWASTNLDVNPVGLVR
jgi:hypothetical protein